ncbi:metallophosphoesterase [Indiicoccus explosivorum]|uniref:metallophosphoesterase n=1 Tax=Indiicoccus explosivorum TaxID=1917864 RepID=UPI000B449134|nr:metallophosphoesterase [Indiicoccus explosivorum]
MKLAILSDIHEGLNRKNTETSIMAALNRWIAANRPDVFLIAGDMTAGPEKSLKLLEQLQADFPAVRVLFVHGNHDVYAADSQKAYETLLAFRGNLGNGPAELGGGWVAVGDGGWYDYSFAIDGYDEADFERGTFGSFTWPDKLHARWPESDIGRTELYAEKLERQLRAHVGKKVILVTHTVPFRQFVQVKGDPSWDFFNAMMGSARYGELAERYGVKKVVFGHIHTRYRQEHNGIDAICSPLGYFPHEWGSASPDEEIASAVTLVELDT